MQNEPRVTMASPAPGFTSRVMARLEERERVQARRRALLGATMLVSVVGTVITFVSLWIVSWISILARPEAVAPMVEAFAALFSDWGKLFEGVWIAVTVIAQNVGLVPLLVYSCAVLMMTAVWLQIVQPHTSFAK